MLLLFLHIRSADTERMLGQGIRVKGLMSQPSRQRAEYTRKIPRKTEFEEVYKGIVNKL